MCGQTFQFKPMQLCSFQTLLQLQPVEQPLSVQRFAEAEVGRALERLICLSRRHAPIAGLVRRAQKAGGCLMNTNTQLLTMWDGDVTGQVRPISGTGTSHD